MPTAMRLEDLLDQLHSPHERTRERAVRRLLRRGRAGFTPDATFASDDYIAVQALVAAGLGVSVIPGLAVAHPLPGVAVRRLASGAPSRRISAA